jgi:hypothetical protein
MALLDAWLPAADRDAPSESGDAALVGEYAFMAVMETIGFARFFRDPLVATVGGLGMLPIAGTAVARMVARTVARSVASPQAVHLDVDPGRDGGSASPGAPGPYGGSAG